MFNLNLLQWWGMERGKVEGVLPEGVVSGICRTEELFGWLLFLNHCKRFPACPFFPGHSGWAGVWSGLGEQHSTAPDPGTDPQ